jgi:hypothetical protein
MPSALFQDRPPQLCDLFCKRTLPWPKGFSFKIKETAFRQQKK